MSTNFTYQVALKLNNKGYLVAVDQATGKTVKLEHALHGVSNSSEGVGASGALGMLKYAAGAGIALVAINQIKNATVGLAKATIQSAAEFETGKVRLQQFTGSAESANKEMEMLADFAANTPFQLNGIIDAQIQLRAFGGDALATQENLTMVGDAAAAVGQPINELSNWMGRAYAAMQEGKPLGEVFNRLRELGLAVPGVNTRLDEMRASGASTTEMWKVFSAQFDKTNGAMARLADTFNGKISTMKDTWDEFLRSTGNNGPLDTAKIAVTSLIETIQFFNRDTAETEKLGKAISQLLATSAISAAELAISLTEVLSPILKILGTYNEMKKYGVAFQDYIMLPVKLGKLAYKQIKEGQDDVQQAGRELAEVLGVSEEQYKSSAKTQAAFSDSLDAVKGSLERYLDVFDEALKKPDPFEKYKIGFEDYVDTLTGAANYFPSFFENYVMLPEYIPPTNKEVKAIKESADLMKKVASAVKSTQTPYEKLNLQLADYQALLAKINPQNEKYAGLLESIARVKEEIFQIDAKSIALDPLSATDNYILYQERLNEVLARTKALVAETRTEEELRTEKLAEYAEQLRLLFEMGQGDSDAFKDALEAYNRVASGAFDAEESPFLKMQEHMMTLQDVARDVKQDLGNMFAGVLSGSVKAKDALKNMYQGMIQSLAQWISQKIMGMILVDSTEKTLAVKNVAINSAASASDLTRGAAAINAWAQAIPFAGAGIAQAYIAGMMANMVAAKVMATGITAFADGGIINPVNGGQLILAGERGERELIAPERKFMAWADALQNGKASSSAPPRQFANYGLIFGIKDLERVIDQRFARMERRAAR